MSKSKKKTDIHADGNGTAVAELPETALPPNEVRPEPELQPAPPQDDKRKPLVTFRINSDRATSISLSLWANMMTNSRTGEQFEQLSVTFQRRYLDDQGWHTGGSWRIHDLPVLVFLIQKAHAFALDRRCEDSSIPF